MAQGNQAGGPAVVRPGSLPGGDVPSEVTHGAIYHIASRARREVEIDDDLRAALDEVVNSIRRDISEGHTPPPVNDAPCPSCSLVDACIPAVLAGGAPGLAFEGDVSPAASRDRVECGWSQSSLRCTRTLSPSASRDRVESNEACTCSRPSEEEGASNDKSPYHGGDRAKI